MTDWADRARKLADEISDLTSREWYEAVCAVPRHDLVPFYYLQSDDGTWRQVDVMAGESELATVYSDTTLITALADAAPEGRGSGQVTVSSSTMPGLMVTMLEALRIRDGDSVLEIGTGTGYNAGLLSARLGSDHVYSVDVDPTLVEAARERLAAIGHTPTLVARDGDQGLAEFGPYDRIIATCAVPAIPAAWLEQTKPGGLILVDFKPSGHAGNLVLLECQGEIATGRFLSTWAGFMAMRHLNVSSAPRQPRRDRTNATERHTAAPAYPWLHPVPWFLAQFGMPTNVTYGEGADYTYLSAPDGSWCEVRTDDARVLEGGPVSLWRAFEDAYDRWRAAGEPEWHRFGLTATPDQHTVWLDRPDSAQRWGD